MADVAATSGGSGPINRLAHFIGGRSWEKDGSEPVQVIDPSTETSWASFVCGTQAEVHEAVLSARRGLDALAQLSPLDRGRLLGRIARRLEAEREDLADLTVTEVGKPLDQARVDVAKAVDWFDYASGWPARQSGLVPPTSVPGRWAYTLRQPIGVVTAILPWNYPLMLSAWKVAPALAAGCSVVLKPSEFTPASALRLAELASEEGLPPGVLNVVLGDGETGEALIRGEGDKVSFTGSVPVGRRIASLASARNRAVTLELGGKSAVILAPDVASDSTTQQVAVAKVVNEGVLHNSGQACNAASRLIVPAEHEGAILEAAEEILEAAVIGPPRQPATDLGPLASARQLDRVEGFVRRATEDRAQVVGTGRLLGNGYYYRPGVVCAPPQAEIAREEVFGPILTLLPYRDLEEAVEIANESAFGLAAGIFSRDLNLVHRVAQQLTAGHVYVNHWSTQDPSVPFGGRRSSGLGTEHGEEGIDAFLVTKSVWLEEDG
jgi:acyl-CoA reductase-like NAD-dependent aldehyde dehydrogenase